jgi:helix-turn-helix protein
MSVPTHMLPTKRGSSRVVLHTVGPTARLKEACTALASLGFTIVPVAEVTSSDPLWTAGVGDAAPVTLTMLPDDALVPAAAAVSNLLGAFQAGQALAGARGKEGLSQRQLAALTGIPQRHISEMEHSKRPIGKAHAKLLAKALNVDYRVLL